MQCMAVERMVCHVDMRLDKIEVAHAVGDLIYILEGEPRRSAQQLKSIRG